MAEEEMDALRDRLNAMTELAKVLFEQQFIRCEGGRMPADPEWDDLEPGERDDWWDRALDARPLIKRASEGRDLLLWLHAEAVWKLSLPCGDCHPCMNWNAEVLRRERDETESSRQAWAEEAMRLQVRLEEVREDRQRRIEIDDRLRTALCVALGHDTDPDEYPGDEVLLSRLAGITANASSPVCTVHPGGPE